MNVYWLIVIAVIILGMVLPQYGNLRKWYIWIMAILHAFVCGFRYMYLTGDLMKYAADYNLVRNYGWFSDEVFREGRNSGFFWLMKLISTITNGDFQVLLIILAVITEVIVAIFIFRYSPMPWFSYLVWNCMGYYVAGFSLIKQSLAMAIVMCAMMSIFEQDKKRFVFFTLLAGFIHVPAFVFLPAYWIANKKITDRTILGYIFFAIFVFVSKNQIVDLMSNIYYEEEEFMLMQDNLGGRFFLIVLLLICGIVLKGFKEKNFEKVFNMLVLAAIFQMLSGFDNVFSRLADYYLQFTVLYIPMLFYEPLKEVPINKKYGKPILPFNNRSLKILIVLVAVILIWFYDYTCIGVTIEYAVDDYTNFRFMWDVVN